jgi:hypothetical protein
VERALEGEMAVVARHCRRPDEAGEAAGGGGPSRSTRSDLIQHPKFSSAACTWRKIGYDWMASRLPWTSQDDAFVQCRASPSRRSGTKSGTGVETSEERHVAAKKA